jgi:hypothetical protein
MSENVNAECNNAENAIPVDDSKKRKRIDSSSKLWHCRLGHISKGRIERLVKESILPLLELSELEQCVDCIKGKLVKKIKKCAKRSTGVLELIHTASVDLFQ